MVGPEGGVGGIIATLHDYIRQEGRDPSEVGIEGSVSIADGTPEDWVQQAAEWKAAGATHISVGTTGAGFSSPDQHIEALGRFMEAAVDVRS